MNSFNQEINFDPQHISNLDAHAPASLLKLWYRELYDPLIPDEFYNECTQTDDPKEVMAIVDRIPPLNQLVSQMNVQNTKKLTVYFLLGANIPYTFSARIRSTGGRRLHKNGFFQFGYGVCTECFALHISRSKDYFGEYPQGDEFYTNVNNKYGYIIGSVYYIR